MIYLNSTTTNNFNSKRTRLLYKNNIFKIPLRGSKFSKMLKMPGLTSISNQATPPTPACSSNNTSSSTSTTMSNSNSNVSSSMSNSSYTGSTMSSSASSASNSNSSYLGSIATSAVNFVTNVTHPKNYRMSSLYPSNPSRNSFTTTHPTTNTNNTQIVPVDQVVFPPMNTINIGANKISYNHPTLAVYLGEIKSRFCFVFQLNVENISQYRNSFGGRMYTHRSGRFDVHGEYQHHEFLDNFDIDFQSQTQYLTELRYSNSEKDFRLINFPSQSNEAILVKGYKRTKDLAKIAIILLQDSKILDHYIATGKIDPTVTNMTPSLFKQLAAKAINHDPTYFS